MNDITTAPVVFDFGSGSNKVLWAQALNIVRHSEPRSSTYATTLDFDIKIIIPAERTTEGLATPFGHFYTAHTRAIDALTQSIEKAVHRSNNARNRRCSDLQTISLLDGVEDDERAATIYTEEGVVISSPKSNIFKAVGIGRSSELAFLIGVSGTEDDLKITTNDTDTCVGVLVRFHILVHYKNDVVKNALLRGVTAFLRGNQ